MAADTGPRRMTSPETAVRKAFADQARWCAKLGSPFTSALCQVIGEEIDRDTAVGRRVLGHSGPPDALGDALPLRLAGALHALVRAGDVEALAALYPPNPMPAASDLWREVDEILRTHEATLQAWLEQPPQTNEVARSTLLMAGLCVVVEQWDLPVRLFELGASAGLNMQLDRYGYRYGDAAFGPGDSGLVFTPDWQGKPPPRADVKIISRRGVDINPLNAGRTEERDRLMAYVWPDQRERMARMEAALAIASEDPPTVDRGDAAAWLEQMIAGDAKPGSVRVVMHSIAEQYFPAETRDHIAATMSAAGAKATPETPLCWLRFEIDPEFRGTPTLRLITWPDGAERLLAKSHPHCTWVEWLG